MTDHNHGKNQHPDQDQANDRDQQDTPRGGTQGGQGDSVRERDPDREQPPQYDRDREGDQQDRQIEPDPERGLR